jgi:hypothetical protein
MHGVDITLAHEDRVVGTDQHRTERVVAVRDRVAGDGIGRAEVGDHLVARHSAQPEAREASWEGAGDTSLFVAMSQSRHVVERSGLQLAHSSPRKPEPLSPTAIDSSRRNQNTSSRAHRQKRWEIPCQATARLSGIVSAIS